MSPGPAWSAKSVLVTGATGIVGSWLTRRLVDGGARVVVLVRDADPHSELVRSGTLARTTLVQGQLEDYAAVERALNEHEVEVVFHLGAQTIVGTAYRSPLPTFEANVRGTYHLLEAARRIGLPRAVVVASSDKAYGSVDQLPYTEETPLQGRHPYDVSKSCADLIAQSYATTYATPVAIARCGNIYGGGDLNWSRIVPGTIRSLLRGERPRVRSDGTCVRDYLYVEDAIDAYLSLAEALLTRPELRGEAFNFGPAQPLSVLELIAEIQAVVGGPELAPVILDEARAEIQAQYLASAKAERLLGWSPRVGLRAGLEATLAWYRDYLAETS